MTKDLNSVLILLVRDKKTVEKEMYCYLERIHVHRTYADIDYRN